MAGRGVKRDAMGYVMTYCRHLGATLIVAGVAGVRLHCVWARGGILFQRVSTSVAERAQRDETEVRLCMRDPSGPLLELT